jgi:hypothetical protein
MTTPLKLLDFRGTFARGMYFLGLTLTVIVLCAGRVSAQQTLELPMPQSQATQPFRPHAQPTAPPLVPPNNVQTIPEVPPPPAPPPAQPQAEEPPPPEPPVPQPEPVLPAVFRGCWRGVVDEVDRMQRLPGAPRLGLWMPKTYLLCYRRVGDGPFKLTFTEAGVQGTRIINTSGQLRLVSTDGRSYAKMRAYLHFDEFRAPTWFSASTFPVDEETDLQCTIEPDGMHATGVVYGEREGAPWFRAWWHTTLFHVAKLSE